MHSNSKLTGCICYGGANARLVFDDFWPLLITLECFFFRDDSDQDELIVQDHLGSECILTRWFFVLRGFIAVLVMHRHLSGFRRIFHPHLDHVCRRTNLIVVLCFSLE